MDDKEKIKFLLTKLMQQMQSIETITYSLQTQIQQKQELKQLHEKILAELPLHKINDDIFDVDSEVLKSEKHWLEFMIKSAIDDLEFLNGIKITIAELMQKQVSDIQTSSDDTSEDVKKARRERILKSHPDRGGSEEELRSVLAEFD